MPPPPPTTTSYLAKQNLCSFPLNHQLPNPSFWRYSNIFHYMQVDTRGQHCTGGQPMSYSSTNSCKLPHRLKYNHSTSRSDFHLEEVLQQLHLLFHHSRHDPCIKTHQSNNPYKVYLLGRVDGCWKTFLVSRWWRKATLVISVTSCRCVKSIRAISHQYINPSMCHC